MGRNKHKGKRNFFFMVWTGFLMSLLGGGYFYFLFGDTRFALNLDYQEGSMSGLLFILLNLGMGCLTLSGPLFVINTLISAHKELKNTKPEQFQRLLKKILYLGTTLALSLVFVMFYPKVMPELRMNLQQIFSDQSDSVVTEETTVEGVYTGHGESRGLEDDPWYQMLQDSGETEVDYGTYDTDYDLNIHHVEPHRVDGYYRSDGNYVDSYWRGGDDGYYRSDPDGYLYNNLNPYE